MKYRRIVLKLSGEALAGTSGHGIDSSRAGGICDEVAALSRGGSEIVLVVGGGNIFRGATGTGGGIGRAAGDMIGMLATLINALALKEFLQARSTPTSVFSAVHVEKAAPFFVREKALEALGRGDVVIVACGTGNPYFTTDTAAALRCAELGAEVLLKGTKVDGVYDRDPVTNPHAKRFDRLDYDEAIGRNLRVMDITALSFCRENAIPIIVFDLTEEGNLGRCVSGEPVGSIVSKEGFSNGGH